MAIGNRDLGRAEEILFAISSYIDDMKYSWNTFQYVTKSLNEWADETTVGQNSKTQLGNVTDTLYKLLDNTNNLKKVVSNFIDNQYKINKGGY